MLISPRVVELWRYPVKSMQGERLKRAKIHPLGIRGDRRFSVLDLEANKILSGRREPRLLEANASTTDEGVYIETPNGNCLIVPDDFWMQRHVNKLLSDWLDRPVELIKSRDPRLVDGKWDWRSGIGSGKFTLK